MLGGLLAANHLTTMEDMPGVVAEYAALAGFSKVRIYVTDLQRLILTPLPGQYDESGRPLEPLRIDATLAGRAYSTVEMVRAPDSVGDRVWVPLLDGTERVGVLGLTMSEPGEVAEWRVKQMASLVTMLLVEKRLNSDSFARLVRARPMALSAEVLMNLLPPGTFATEDVVVSAALEPAYEVGGDSYDYAIDGDVLHVSIFDAMGHDAAAGVTATIAMGACRNHRIEQDDLPMTAEAIDAAIREQFTGRFSTGILSDLNLRTGWLSWVNRGHHPPLVLRDGRLAAVLESEPDPPMGFGLTPSTGLVRYQLQPGDRLVFYTDGIIEAKSPDGELFGLERFIDFIIRHEADGLTAPETLRRLIQAVLRHQRDRLQDDATVLIVEWHGQRHEQLLL
ncbi:SpoIIE family protein phosphatase [Nonomuraea sp. K274]|uniref:SpoIIE family protein phosphatase n=2 Tax=Nonomuraea cypriaca TaxID=1187855 RepID=A0A931A8S8_9ACTN|nr:SpoIIE family protein phosphatase [Nonomuraea cypriaca]